jgi:hypothetical protein
MADKKISQLTASTVPLAGTEVLPIVQSGVTKQVATNQLLSYASPTDNAVLRFNGTSGAVQNSSVQISDSGNLIVGSAPEYNILNIQKTASDIYDPLSTAAQRDEGNTIFVLNPDTTENSFSQIAFQHRTSTIAISRIVSINTNAAGSNTAIAFVTETGGFPVENARITGNGIAMPAGKGIDFSADGQAAGMTSELLDDYEEGTWTPNLGGDEVLTGATGVYTKIGRQVTVSFTYTVTTIGTGSTQTISGLPFTSNAVLYAGSVAYFANSVTSVTSIILRTNFSSTTLQIVALTAAGTTAESVDINQNGTVFYGTITYFV